MKTGGVAIESFDLDIYNYLSFIHVLLSELTVNECRL